MDHEFRSVAFGGFCKQDVLDFLETTAKQNAQQRESLEKQLEEEKKRADTACNRLDAAQSQVAELDRERQRLQNEGDETLAKLERTQEELRVLREENARLAQELEQQRQEIARLKPEAEAYAAVKDRTAGVELEAHRRAQAVQDEAQQQAEQLRQDTTAWLRQVEREYDALRTQVESTVAHAADELSKAGSALNQVIGLLARQDVELETIDRSYAAAEENAQGFSEE